MEANEDKYTEAVKLCTKYGLNKFWEALPMHYLTRIGEDGINLSGGQKQLLGLSRALLKRPRLLLLDEPTNNMDKESIDLFWKILEQEKNNMIIIVVTHDDRLGNSGARCLCVPK
ncbi:MAG: ATP-binding cassette domain-containing protein [Bacteroidales bacterium]